MKVSAEFVRKIHNPLKLISFSTDLMYVHPYFVTFAKEVHIVYCRCPFVCLFFTQQDYIKT